MAPGRWRFGYSCRSRKAFNVPAEIHAAAGLGGRQDAVGPACELGFEIFVTHRILHPADRAFDVLFELAAAFEAYGDADPIFLARGIDVYGRYYSRFSAAGFTRMNSLSHL